MFDDTAFTEMRGRIKEADRSVPQKDGDYLYWVEFQEGAEYKLWWRKPVAGGKDEKDAGEVANLAHGAIVAPKVPARQRRGRAYRTMMLENCQGSRRSSFSAKSLPRPSSGVQSL